MSEIAELLFAYAKNAQSSAYGIDLDDFKKIIPSADLGRVVAAGLHSNDPLDRRISLLFCRGFIQAGSLKGLGTEIEQSLPSAVQKLLGDKDSSVRLSAYEVLPSLRCEIPNYREQMLIALRDVDSQVRAASLAEADSFLEEKEIAPILHFEGDEYAAEVSPGGPVYYALRNQAFLHIEKRLGLVVPKREAVAMNGLEPIYWWDWAPLLKMCLGERNGFWRKFFRTRKK